jgi:leader peptidase (prepilin peptidase)/N-methyltransferase
VSPRLVPAALALAVPLWAGLVLADWLTLAATCLLGWLLLAAAVVDFRCLRLPDPLILPLMPLGLLASWHDGLPPTDAVLGLIAGGGGFVLLNAAYRCWRHRDGLGRGDAKLLGAAGAWLGWAALPSVVLIGASLALVWLLPRAWRGHRLTATTVLPFGPFLAAGLWLVWLYGPLGR